VLARAVLGLGAGGSGALMTCVGAGAMLGALWLAAAGQRLRRQQALRVSSHVFPLLLVLVSFSRMQVVTGVLLFGVGVCMVVQMAVINGLLQSAAPDVLRGRVISIFVAVYIGTNPIGSTVSGLIARELGVAWAIGGMAAVMGVYAVWAFRRYPELRSAS
jgi:predicted MFS family arabinose efflux permease